MSRSLCMARVYLRRRTERRGPGFVGWLFQRPLARSLAEEALRCGVVYATVTLGHMGFVQGAKSIEHDILEIPSGLLPTCLELVAPRPILDAFIASHKKELKDATIVMLEGIDISILGPTTHPDPSAPASS